MKKQKYTLWIVPGVLMLIMAATLFAYVPGLNGPFLFDDTLHISKNQQVQITDLSFSSLEQAWNSSLAPKPWHRPISQLSFGINHALNGLDPWAFKTTNLIIFLITGTFIFLFSKQLLYAYTHSQSKPFSTTKINFFALTVTAIWLLHPLNVSTVLYPVQRMAQLSTLLLFVAMWLYINGRIKLVQDNGGLTNIVAAFVVAGIGIFAKENAVLLPLFLLVIEFTLLRDYRTPQSRLTIRLIRILGIALPLAVGVIYVLAHPGLYGYETRPFTLEERVLTQFRVLWFYVQLIFAPDISLMGLHHDDFPLSRDLLTPTSTLVALVAWVLLLLASLIYARRFPVPAFACLFFLAAHAMESSFLPLEMIFEHRNHLALLGPAFALAGLFILYEHKALSPAILTVVVLTICLGLAAITHLRATDWGNETRLVVSEVIHHPESKRANFRAAQFAMRGLDNPEAAERAYSLARAHFEKVLTLDQSHPDALFGLIVLNLHVAKPPEPQWVDQLEAELASGTIDATRFSPVQFNFLVKWHIGNNYPLPQGVLPRLFDAISKNKHLHKRGQAGILLARAIYFDKVLKLPEQALPLAKGAVNYWPTRWHYRKRYTQLLARLGHWQEAEKVLLQGIKKGLAANQLDEARQMLKKVQQRKPLPSDIKN